MIESNPYQKALLVALNTLPKRLDHIYAGTVSDAEKARRRKRDKAAKQARKTARGSR